MSQSIGISEEEDEFSKITFSLQQFVPQYITFLEEKLFDIFKGIYLKFKEQMEDSVRTRESRMSEISTESDLYTTLPLDAF